MKKIGNVKLDYEDYEGKDLYSDGSVEDDLLEIVKNVSIEEYSNIISERGTWPILYHLSPIRSNIVEWIPISLGDDVLEIGSGCGAITGVLSKKAKTVTCIELSEKRSLINAYRNKEQENISILIGNYEKITKRLDKKYDYITLIGVYEYAESYIHVKNPYVEFLKNIEKHLKIGGKIIIAIENRLGLKYWAGCKEDHVGKYFEGIEGYLNSKGVKTFSKKELTDLIQDAGFNNMKFFYPYPDYKFPLSIFSDERLPKVGELSQNMRNFDQDRLVCFDEESVYESIIDNGLFSVFSNSFLVIIER